MRATGAGLSCPDWPLCFGTVVPDNFGNGVAQEVIHRYIATAVGVISLLLFYLSRTVRKQSPSWFRFAKIILPLVIIQGIFGGLTVTQKLNPWVVTTHLALGTVFLQLVFQKLFSGYAKKDGEEVGLFSGKQHLSIAIFLQVLIGGFMATSGASLACNLLVACSESGFMGDGGIPAQHLHMTHRIFAVVIVILSLVIGLLDVKRAKQKSDTVIGLAIAIIAVTQLGIGVLNVYTKISSHVTVTHLVLAQALLFFSLLRGRRRMAK